MISVLFPFCRRGSSSKWNSFIIVYLVEYILLSGFAYPLFLNE
jgi:hypothetical protein